MPLRPPARGAAGLPRRGGRRRRGPGRICGDATARCRRMCRKGPFVARPWTGRRAARPTASDRPPRFCGIDRNQTLGDRSARFLSSLHTHSDLPRCSLSDRLDATPTPSPSTFEPHDHGREGGTHVNRRLPLPGVLRFQPRQGVGFGCSRRQHALWYPRDAQSPWCWTPFFRAVPMTCSGPPHHLHQRGEVFVAIPTRRHESHSACIRG